jgi:WD40 repeat protein
MKIGSRIALSADGNTVAMAGNDADITRYGDGTIEIWDIHDPANPRQFGCIRRAHGNAINRMTISPDNKTLATAGWDQTVKLWELSRCARMHDEEKEHLSVTLQVRAGECVSVAFTPDGKELYVGNEDSTISVWDVAAKIERGVLSGHKGKVTDLHFLDDNTLISASLDKTVRYWRATPKAELDDPVRVDWLKRKLE